MIRNGRSAKYAVVKDRWTCKPSASVKEEQTFLLSPVDVVAKLPFLSQLYSSQL